MAIEEVPTYTDLVTVHAVIVMHRESLQKYE